MCEYMRVRLCIIDIRCRYNRSDSPIGSIQEEEWRPFASSYGVGVRQNEASPSSNKIAEDAARNRAQEERIRERRRFDLELETASTFRAGRIEITGEELGQSFPPFLQISCGVVVVIFCVVADSQQQENRQQALVVQ